MRGSNAVQKGYFKSSVMGEYKWLINQCNDMLHLRSPSILVAMKFTQLANFKKAITRTILKVWETKQY